MEAWRQMLACPVCLELFTPPILILPCAHNFCKQCLEKIMLHQNCHHVNGFFHCPLCRKVIYLRGRGIVNLLRNSLVESILEKFKSDREKICTQEKRQLSQICEEHGENMNLMCLTDDEPICAICKLFGKHEDHSVAKVSEAYSARKKAFIKKLHLVHKKSEDARKETEMLINELTAGATDTKVMIDTVGMGLLKGIRYRMAELQSKLHHDYSTKLEKLQVIANEAEVSGQLYQQMETLLEQHENSVQFLQEEKQFKEKVEKLLERKALYQDPSKHKISMQEYFEELIRGMNIKDYLSTECEEKLSSTTDIPETRQLECPAFVFSDESPDHHFCKEVLQQFEKSNDIKQGNFESAVPLHCSTNANMSISENSAFTDLLAG
ncbi:PREDICTED: tripartite motif-containing protein 54-like [Charadrius vociferus]|uniref:tripartite motif-containing protein 54-like n=1 Tax=Charadrius vociferus TaxID=50402 RepID=UPI00052142AB|nr:PREDICTED: tripartite motif-containing protein 54-like [Charadrius vociferus]